MWHPPTEGRFILNANSDRVFSSLHRERLFHFSKSNPRCGAIFKLDTEFPTLSRLYPVLSPVDRHPLIFMCHRSFITLMVNNSPQQHVLISSWVALGIHIFRDHIGGILGMGPVRKFHLVHSGIKDGVGVGSSVNLPFHVPGALTDFASSHSPLEG